VQQDLQVLKGALVLLVLQEQLGRKELLDKLGLQVPREQLVLRAHKVFKETREKSVQQVLRGQLALQAPQEQQGL
jgi:hypothetical protein